MQFITHVLIVSSLGVLTAAAPDGTCAAGDTSCGAAATNGKLTSAGSYFWPMAMGHPNYYSNPPWPGPTDLQTSIKWSFFGPTGTRFEESFVGPVIDDKKNIYVNGDRMMYKLNPDGELLWGAPMPGQASGDAPVLYDGSVSGATNDGKVFSFDMENGFLLWTEEIASEVPTHHSQLAAHKGVIVGTGGTTCFSIPFPSCGHAKVFGLNSTDGKQLWSYTPEEAIWDAFPQFPDDESLIIMDRTGQLHRLQLQSGKLIWTAGGKPYSWTNGCQFVASNGLTYAVEADPSECQPYREGYVSECAGYVKAYKTSDGSSVWSQRVPKPPNSSPVVGRVGGPDEGLSLVMPIGAQSMYCFAPVNELYFKLDFLPFSVRDPLSLLTHRFSVWLGDYNWLLWGSMTRTHELYVFDAENGNLKWVWTGPTINRKQAPGDEDGWMFRFARGLRLSACPSTTWNQPRIGSDGTIYVGNEGGNFYAIRDANGNQRIEDTEVSVYDTKATFGHQGSAHAPGMVVSVNFDGVFAFKS